MWTHEQTYKSNSISSIIHRTRLEKLISVFDSLQLADKGVLGDFGCSDGFIFSVLREKFDKENKQWQLVGFDFNEKFLQLAEQRNIPGTEYHEYNLNNAPTQSVLEKWNESFDVVTCFETLEHIKYWIALETLYTTCKANGYIFISVPNEKGIQGITKYMGRYILRKTPYKDFFNNQSQYKYLWYLLSNQSIEEFRSKDRENPFWPHLGFDYKSLEKFIDEKYVQPGLCTVVKKDSSFLNFNLMYVLQKNDINKR